MAQPIPRGRAGYLLRLVRGIVWVTESQEVGRKHGSSCDSVTPAFFRKCVLKWRRLLRKKRRGYPRHPDTSGKRVFLDGKAFCARASGPPAPRLQLSGEFIARQLRFQKLLFLLLQGLQHGDDPSPQRLVVGFLGSHSELSGNGILFS